MVTLELNINFDTTSLEGLKQKEASTFTVLNPGGENIPGSLGQWISNFKAYITWRLHEKNADYQTPLPEILIS